MSVTRFQIARVGDPRIGAQIWPYNATGTPTGIAANPGDIAINSTGELYKWNGSAWVDQDFSLGASASLPSYFVYPETYGAGYNGAASDDWGPAITQALLVAQQTGVDVKFEGKTYGIRTTIQMPTIPYGESYPNLIGTRGATKLQKLADVTILNFAGSSARYLYWAKVQDMWFDGNGATYDGNDRFTTPLVSNNYTESCRFINCIWSNNYGPAISGQCAWDTYYDSCEIDYCGATDGVNPAVLLFSAAGDGGNSTNNQWFHNCRVEDSRTGAIWMVGATQNDFLQLMRFTGATKIEFSNGVQGYGPAVKLVNVGSFMAEELQLTNQNFTAGTQTNLDAFMYIAGCQDVKLGRITGNVGSTPAGTCQSLFHFDGTTTQNQQVSYDNIALSSGSGSGTARPGCVFLWGGTNVLVSRGTTTWNNNYWGVPLDGGSPTSLAPTDGNATGLALNGARLGYVTSSSTTTAVTVGNSQAPFTQNDVGKAVILFSDTAAGTPTTISSVNSSSSITLSANSGITLTGASTGCFMIYGTDDSAALNAYLAAQAAALVAPNLAVGYNEPYGAGRVTVTVPGAGPQSICVVASQIVVPSGISLNTLSMLANLQTDRYNPVVAIQPYGGFKQLLLDACFGAGVLSGTSSSPVADVQGETLTAWHVGKTQATDGSSRYQDVLQMQGNGHLIDMVWAKGGYHTLNHISAGDTMINRVFCIGAVQPILMTSVNQVAYNTVSFDSCGQVGGGTSGCVLDNACSDVDLGGIKAFPVSTVSPARTLDNVLLLGLNSTNKNVDIRGRISAQLMGGVGINLAAAQDVQFDLICSNTASNSSGGTAMTTAVVWGANVAGAADIRAAMSGSITPYSGTVGGRYSYVRGGVEYVVQSGSAPAVAATTALGTSPPAPTITGNDARGFIAAGTGTSPSTGSAITVTFASSTGYVGVPIVNLTSRNAVSAALQAYVVNASATGFTIGFTVAPSASQAAGTYAFNYRVTE